MGGCPRPLAAAAVLLLAAAAAGAQEAPEPGPAPGPAPGEEPAPRDLELRFGGRFAVDGILRDRRNSEPSGVEAAAARPRVEAVFREEFRLSVEADLLGDATPDHLYEAWAGWRAGEALDLRAGRMRIALGTEFATPEEDLPHVGPSFVSWLDGRYDLGVRAAGTAGGEGLWYEASATAGCGFGLDGRRRGSPQQSLRAVIRPFRLAGRRAGGEADLLRGILLGAGAARLGDFEDPLNLETPLGSPVFATPDLDGDGGRWIHLEAGAAAGPVAGGIEVVRGAARNVRGPGGPQTVDELTAFTASLAVSLTGERRGWREGRWEREAPRSAAGAWEVALRYSNGDMDRDLFRAGWTTYDPSTQEVRTFSATLGWRPSDQVRFSLGWVKTIADDALTVFGGGGPTTVPRTPGGNRDSSFVLRVEVAF